MWTNVNKNNLSTSQHLFVSNKITKALLLLHSQMLYIDQLFKYTQLITINNIHIELRFGKLCQLFIAWLLRSRLRGCIVAGPYRLPTSFMNAPSICRAT